MTDPTVTVLCADLDPSAANAAARTLAGWLATSSATPVDVVSLWTGPWAAAFARIGPTWVVNAADGSGDRSGAVPLDLERAGAASTSRPVTMTPDQLVQAAARALRIAGLSRLSDGARAAGLRRQLRRSAGPAWLAGASAARLLAYIPRSRRVLAHQGAHDPPIDDQVRDPEDRRALRSRVDGWVAGSSAAADALRAAGIVVPITVLPDLIHASLVHAPPRAAAGPPVVAAYGEHDWWDHPDLFVQLGWELLHRRSADLDLLWVAGGATDRMLWPLRHDLAHAGLAERARVAPRTGVPLEQLATADVIALTGRGIVAPVHSREIEAMGLPVVRFTRPGESVGLLGGTAVVPFPDERAMADAILSLLADASVADAARAAAGHVRARHDVLVVAPALRDLLFGP